MYIPRELYLTDVFMYLVKFTHGGLLQLNHILICKVLSLILNS